MSFVKVLMSVPDSATTMQSILDLSNNATTYSGAYLVKLIQDMIDGAQLSYTKVSTGSLQATGTLTSTGAAVNGDTASVANVTITAKTSGAIPTNGEFNLSATPAIQAANIALAINSVPALAGIVTAISALGVTTIMAVQPGLSGNGLQLVSSLTNVTAGAFASGSDGLQIAINYGAAS